MIYSISYTTRGTTPSTTQFIILEEIIISCSEIILLEIPYGNRGWAYFELEIVQAEWREPYGTIIFILRLNMNSSLGITINKWF